jgi:uncharacterized membrane protein YidH (DUF202 family)
MTAAAKIKKYREIKHKKDRHSSRAVPVLFLCLSLNLVVLELFILYSLVAMDC